MRRISKELRSFEKPGRADAIIAVMLALVVFILGFGYLTNGLTYWGDDFAAYISEGIAISEGKLEEQARLNYLMHPSVMSEEADSSGLVYVWGYPLLLSIVHKLVGFDTVNYSSILYYKLPSVICLSLFAAIFYLFCRRRFPRAISVLACVMLCTYKDFYKTIEIMYGDVVFLFAAMLSLLLYEYYIHHMFAQSPHKVLKQCLLAAALGISMWFTYEVRLNGNTIVYIILFSHALYILKNRKQMCRRTLWLHVLPYVLFLCIRLISESVLMPATANISDVGKTDFAMIRYNIRKYIIEHSVDFLCDLTGLKYGYIALLPITLCAIGVIAEGFKLENLHFTLLIIGTYVVLILLPYNQGLRYMYNILPLIVMYLFYGVLQVSRWISCMLKTPALKRWTRRAALAMIVLLCLNACKAIVIHDCQNLYNKRISQNNLVYSEDVVEMYGAIKTFTPEDCTIAFLKPRALYLNTGRKAFNHNVNGHELMDADYYLFSSGLADTQEKQLLQQYIDQLEIIHSTQGMTLYQIKKTGDL